MKEQLSIIKENKSFSKQLNYMSLIKYFSEINNELFDKIILTKTKLFIVNNNK